MALAASWLAIWGVYSAYYWTNDPSENTLQTVRFYVPAIGMIALLGAWPGTWSFHAMVAGIASIR